VLRAYGDGNLFGEAYGEGPIRVVFLHGWSRRGQDFAACATELAHEGVASVALDLPGFGSSPLPTVAGGARHYAELLAPVLLEMGSDPLVLVGHSLGGRIATVLASRHPELIRAMVLTGAPLVRTSPTSKTPWRYRMIRYWHARGLVGEDRMEKARQRYGSTDYRNSSGLLREVLVMMVNESYEEELSSLEVPVVMVWGENDLEVPVSNAVTAASLLHKKHTLRTVAEVGHFLPVQAPHELVISTLEALE
jgi:pimeloyl-ACP methyl ester carboxylesterase